MTAVAPASVPEWLKTYATSGGSTLPPPYLLRRRIVRDLLDAVDIYVLTKPYVGKGIFPQWLATYADSSGTTLPPPYLSRRAGVRRIMGIMDALRGSSKPIDFGVDSTTGEIRTAVFYHGFPGDPRHLQATNTLLREEPAKFTWQQRQLRVVEMQERVRIAGLYSDTKHVPTGLDLIKLLDVTLGEVNAHRPETPIIAHDAGLKDALHAWKKDMQDAVVSPSTHYAVAIGDLLDHTNFATTYGNLEGAQQAMRTGGSYICTSSVAMQTAVGLLWMLFDSTAMITDTERDSLTEKIDYIIQQSVYALPTHKVLSSLTQDRYTSARAAFMDDKWEINASTGGYKDTYDKCVSLDEITRIGYSPGGTGVTKPIHAVERIHALANALSACYPAYGTPHGTLSSTLAKAVQAVLDVMPTFGA